MLMRWTRMASAAAVLMMLAACGPSQDTGVNRGGVKIGKPYNVNGEWYAPKYQPYYDETGLASWYGPGFHGKKTSYGENFDTNSLTAAHPTLPLPSMVEVTNLANNRRVVVRVNDRGPFTKSRIIDLSKAAADRIGMLATGTAKVRVRYLKDETETYIASHGGSVDALTMAGGSGIYSGSSATAPAAPVFSVSSSTLPSAMAPIPASTDAPRSGFVSEALAEDVVAVQARPQAYIPPRGPLGMVSQDLPPLPSMTPATGDTAARISSLSPAPAVQEVASLAPTQLPASMPVGRYPNDNPKDARARSGAIYVQVGAFSLEENAKKTANQLAIYGNASVIPVELPGKKLYRVRLGPLADRGIAQQSLESVMGAGFKDAKIIQ